MTDRKLHPLTPFARAVSVAPGILLAALVFSGASAQTRLIAAAAATAAVVGIGTAVGYLQWQRFSFGFDDAGDFRVDSGVIQHNHQKVQLSRLQSVEVSQPLLPRMFGLAEVVIEVAGGGSRVILRYLDSAEAHDLRNEIIARAAGVDESAPQAPEQVLATVGNGELLLSQLLRVQTISLFLLTGVLLTSAFLTGGVGALGIALVTGGVPAFQVVSEFLTRYDFTVAESPDGLRVRHGLTSKVANTVPPGRVHAVGFSSGPIWRMLGWVRVTVDLGGNPDSGDRANRGSTVLLPVTNWSTARQVVARVLPGVDLDSPDWLPVPRRARWRAPIQWRNIGAAANGQVFMARRGRIEQWWTVVPHGRVQSARITQGPWERPLRLASVHLDTVPGPVRVRVPHMDVAFVRAMVEDEMDRAREARRSAGPDKWMTATRSASEVREPGRG